MLIEITYNVTDVFMSTTETPVYVEISFEQPGSASAVWGSITGTLSNQTDLQNALNAKLDESTIDGGTEGQILSKASATDFDFAWINNYAKYLATNVRNQTGSTIAAFQVVYISGATGNKPLVSLADADTEATSTKTYGVTATSIANNGTGDVVTAGELSGIDTSAFNEGDLLWLSTTAGGVVTSPPAEPAHAVFIGYVVRSHPTLGTIDVSIQNGYELNELHGVQITTPTDNQGLFYNSTSTLWENKSITTALGYTPVPTTRNITINGVTYDLSADRTWTISTGISGSGAAGQVTYWTGASAVSGSSLFSWNNAQNSLALGTTGSSWNLLSAIELGSVGNSISGFINDSAIYISSNAYYNASWKYAVTGKPSTRYIGEAGRHNFLVAPNGTANAAITYNFAMTIFNNGNIGINTNSVDPSVRLGVYGDTLLRGSGATSATTALTVQNSDSSALLKVDNSGSIYIGNAGSRTPYIAPYSDATTQSLTGRAIGFVSTVGPNAAVPAFIFTATSLTATSGTGRFVEISPTYSPTSGTGTLALLAIQSTINQTGGANGITRGLYINPTLTAAADFRAIETSAGNVLFGSNFFWNNTNARLGIGIATPAVSLDVRTSAVGELAYFANTAANSGLIIGTQTNVGYISSISSLSALGFGINGTTTAIRIFTNSNVSINNNVDLGVRFSVVGDTRLIGSGATSATTALTVQNSSSTNLFTVRNDGNVGIGTASPSYRLDVGNQVRIIANGGVVGTIGGSNYALSLQNNATATWLEILNNGGINKGIFFGITTNAFELWNYQGGTIDFYTNITASSGTKRLTIKTTGQVRFVPLASAPASPEAGDVYYDSTLNKLRVYTTAWETITSI